MYPPADHVAVVPLQRIGAGKAGVAGGFDGQFHCADGVAGDQVFDLPRVRRGGQAMGGGVEQGAVGEQQGVDLPDHFLKPR